MNGESSQLNYRNIFFHSNFAHISGSDIFGGALDRCRVNVFPEFSRNFFEFFANNRRLVGFDIIKLIAQFDIDFDYNQVTYPFRPVNNLTKQDVIGLVSSNVFQLCFCANDDSYTCSAHHPRVYIKRGHLFTLRAIIVDQVENPVNGTALASVITDNTRLGIGQSRQLSNGLCFNFTYNIFSTEVNATLNLYPDGPCGNAGISSKPLSVTFLPCDCPNGLQSAPLENECRCECETSLETIIGNCQLDRDTVNVVRQRRDVWIQYVTVNNATGFLHPQCPQDYCLKDPVNLSISLPWNVDTQCAFNRSGIMCGECVEGLSLVFGSSRCMSCGNNYLFLLIAFVLAGVFLVAFILIFNITVAPGTIHGLILYANIVGANSSIFLPQDTTLRFFVSWMNLDVGIETCFYDGMNSYGKALLQLVFPLYIVSLSVLIIVLCNYWGRFAGLIGRKNPVATLCTLILLTYSKLLRTIISSLQFTILTYPNGSTTIVWLYDANVSYFTPSHIPRFLIASVTIAVGFVYVLLFFGQWFRKLSNKKCLSWARNIEYNAFVDAYHAPFVTKHRYWMGMLLLTRIIHHFSSSLSSESAHLLIVTGLVVALLIHKLLVSKLYKNWLVDKIETSCLLNLLIFAIGSYHTKYTNGNQAALASTSVLIAFLTFCAIYCCMPFLPILFW